MGSCLLNFLLVRVKLLKVLFEQLLKFLLINMSTLVQLYYELYAAWNLTKEKLEAGRVGSRQEDSTTQVIRKSLNVVQIGQL